MYLQGIHLSINTKDLKNSLGRTVKYLCKNDIDRSGRGYIFPRMGVITDVYKRHVEFDHSQDYIHFSDMEEITISEKGGGK